MSRSKRYFKLVVQTESGVITVEPPFKITFDALKSGNGKGINKATIQVDNLTESKRLSMAKDTEQIKKIPVALYVGYGDSAELIFKGEVQRGSNRREGPDFVTELYCLDGYGDIRVGFINTCVEADPIGAVLKFLPGIGRGKITKQKALTRPKVMIGDAVTVMNSLITSDSTWYIENGQLNVLKKSEVVSSFIPEVSAVTGLINTPERDQSILTFETLMNPALKINGLCSIRSVTAPHLNGVYRLETITYKGDNYGSTWGQTVSCILQPNYTVI